MNELAVKISELLDITVDSAVELYPVIRGQFMWYSALGKAGWLNMFFALALAIASCVVVVYYYNAYDDLTWSEREENKDSYDLIKAKKLAKIVAMGWAIVIVIWITLTILAHITAPDIILIKGLI
jgi:hypothetical protein